MSLAAAALALAVAAADPASPLGALEARRHAEETAARLLAEQERSVLDTLGEAEAALDGARADLKRVEDERGAASAALARAEQTARAARARLDTRLAELRPRLAARARLGRAGELKVLLASASLADLVKRRYLLDRLLARDLELLGDAKAALAEEETARAERAREAARLASLATEASTRRAQAEARREERETLLAALRIARGFHERAAREAAAQASKLESLVTALPRAPKGAGFAARRGRLPFPAPGPITVPFGPVVNPRFNTVTVQHGVDIAAPAGASVRAVAPGRVAHAGWFKGYGNLVIVDHGGGFHTLVAHLATMRAAMGEEVDAGTVLGTVGDSGSLKGPYLYFEIRDQGRPVDPRPWLAAGSAR